MCCLIFFVGKNVLKTPARNTTAYVRNSSAKCTMARGSPADSLKSVFYHPLRSCGGAHAFRAYRKTSATYSSLSLHQAAVDYITI